MLQWWSAEPSRLSKAAEKELEGASDLAVSAISWWELAWLARNERILVATPVRSWLEGLGGQVRTIGITPVIADAAAALPSTFPGDPADRLIFSTAVEHGIKLVSKDQRLRDHPHPRTIVLW